MDSTILNLLITGIGVPIMTLLTLWARAALSTGEKRERRSDALEDEYRLEMTRRVETLEKEVRELRVELKNRDAEYIELYKQYTTLKAKHEVLQADYDQTKKELHDTQEELTALKEDMKLKSVKMAQEMQKI